MLFRTALAVIALVGAGCAGTPAVEDALFQEGENIVRIQPWPESADPAVDDEFQHPLEISEADLAIVLDSVRIQKQRGFFGREASAVPAFSKKEVTRMAAPISRALAKVSPRERVAFRFSVPSGGWFEGVTSGVIFVKEDRINLILGRYRSASRPHEKDISLADDPLPSPPYFGFRLAAGPNQALVPEEESPAWREAVGDDQWVMIDYREVVAHPPDRIPFPVSTQPAAPEGAPPQPPEGVTDVRERLRLLKELHDEGLITDEEYEKKRTESIENF